MLVKRFFNPILKNYLNSLPKKNIFPIGNLYGNHLTGIYEFYDENLEKHKPFMEIINFHKNILNENNANFISDKIFIENRDLILKDEDKPFEGKIHLDSMNDEGDPCFTCVYYYRIDSGINGGTLEFPPFGKYQPKEDEIVYFDGDYKHRIGKTSGNGIRGTLIMNFKKNLSLNYNEEQ